MASSAHCRPRRGDHAETGGPHGPGDTGTVGAGALDRDHAQGRPSAQELHRGPVASRRRWHVCVAQPTTGAIGDRDVTGVDTAVDGESLIGGHGTAPFSRGLVRSPAGASVSSLSGISPDS